MITQKHRIFLYCVYIFAILVVLHPKWQMVAANSHSEVNTLPNIIVILTDDQDILLNSLEYMPNVNNLLVNQGVNFTNAIVSDPVCCPSRASILTGQYVHNHLVYTNFTPYGYEMFFTSGLESATFNVALQTAGYHTFFFGKYFNYYPRWGEPSYVPPGWDAWYSPAKGTPYNGFDYTLNENGALVAYGSSPEDYLTDVMKLKALEFISSTTGSNQPFFLYLSTYAPHMPSTPAPRHVGKFPDAKVPRVPSYNEADISDKPSFFQQLPILSKPVQDILDDQYQLRIESLQAVDEMVASIVETLDQYGQLENTYIFYTSDNGYHMGIHRFPQGKNTAHEESIHVPLIVRGPQVPIGVNRNHLVSLVDLAPTLSEIAGVPLLLPTDGRSLLPLLSNPPPPLENWRRSILIEYYSPYSISVSNNFNHAESDFQVTDDNLLEPFEVQEFYEELPSYSALRTLTYTYIMYDNGERELYDLVHDPFQLENIVSWAKPDELQDLSDLLQQFRTCVAGECLIFDTRYLEFPVFIQHTFLPLLIRR